MRKDLGQKPLVYPQPVLIISTYNEDGSVDAMNAAWGGVGDDHQVFLCLSKEHNTVENMIRTNAFCVHIADEPHVVESDFLGIVSGNDDPEKFSKSKLHTVKSSYVDAPIITEYPICMECKLLSYEPESCHCFGDIINTSVDDRVLTNGKIDLSKLKAIALDIDNAKYVRIGTEVCDAFSAGLALK